MVDLLRKSSFVHCQTVFPCRIHLVGDDRSDVPNKYDYV